MAFFGENQFNKGTFVHESLDELMQNDNIKPSFYTDFTEGALAAVAEAEQNNTILMTAIGIEEHAYYKSHGEEIVYTEGVLETIGNKIKDIILKIWNKLKELFKRFVLMFDKYFASDKAFVKKYRAKILAADISDLEFEGYPFAKVKNFEIQEFNEADMEKIEKEVNGKDRSDNIDKAKNLVRGFCVKKPGTEIDSTDFIDELKELYYGSTEKESLDGEDLSASRNIGYIENYNDSKKKLERVKLTVDTNYKALIKNIDSEIKEKSKDTKNEKEVAMLSDVRVIAEFTASAIATTVGVILNAIKDRNRQGRAFCVKAMTKGGSFKQESSDFSSDSFLSNVNFI